MSKEEVPGENRTVSPCRARERAFSTQASTSAAFSVGTAGEQWYRQCDLNRDLIVTGTVRIRILILFIAVADISEVGLKKDLHPPL